MNEMKDVLIILLSWASHLSGYPMAELPDVQFKDHQFFVENVCGGKECHVVGWYNDKDIVYIDNRFKDIENGFASSLIVHEFTHYLQDPDMDPCLRELKAYATQNQYIAEVLTTNYRATAKCYPGVWPKGPDGELQERSWKIHENHGRTNHGRCPLRGESMYSLSRHRNNLR